MKKKYTLFAIMAIAFLATSCNDDWKDEQYEHYISFRAPLNDQGTTNIYVPYTRKKNGQPMFGAGKSTYQLPIIVSGSTLNEENITVNVAHDPDTLVMLNNGRYSTRKDLYYRDMGDEQFSFASYSKTAQINAGQRVGLLNLDFDFKNIDMSDKWVLPLQVVDYASSTYPANPRKNYAKALLRVFPFNDYSGDYSGTLLTNKVVAEKEDAPEGEEGEDTDVSITKNAVRGYVVDDNTIFTYAGIVDEEYTDRKRYKIYFKFLGDENAGAVEISCENADDIGFKTSPLITASYRRQSVMDKTRPYLEHRYVIINNIDYYFNYILSDKGSNKKSYVRYHVIGSMTLSRNINTQIPDEDQAIEW